MLARGATLTPLRSAPKASGRFASEARPISAVRGGAARWFRVTPRSPTLGSPAAAMTPAVASGLSRVAVSSVAAVANASRGAGVRRFGPGFRWMASSTNGSGGAGRRSAEAASAEQEPVSGESGSRGSRKRPPKGQAAARGAGSSAPPPKRYQHSPHDSSASSTVVTAAAASEGGGASEREHEPGRKRRASPRRPQLPQQLFSCTAICMAREFNLKPLVDTLRHHPDVLETHLLSDLGSSHDCVYLRMRRRPGNAAVQSAPPDERVFRRARTAATDHRLIEGPKLQAAYGMGKDGAADGGSLGRPDFGNLNLRQHITGAREILREGVANFKVPWPDMTVTTEAPMPSRHDDLVKPLDLSASSPLPTSRVAGKALFGKRAAGIGSPIDSRHRTGDVFVRKDGTFVAWNVSEAVITELKIMLWPSAKDPYRADTCEHDDLRYTLDESRDAVGTLVQHNEQTLADVTFAASQSDDQLLLSKYAISAALAQSVTIEVWDNMLTDFVESFRHVLSSVRDGKITLSRKEATRRFGRIIDLQQQINFHSDMLVAAPDFCWNRPDLEDVFTASRAYFDVNNRISVLTRQLDQMKSHVDFLRDDLNLSHGHKLELSIIALIILEVAFEMVHYAERYGWVEIPVVATQAEKAASPAIPALADGSSSQLAAILQHIIDSGGIV